MKDQFRRILDLVRRTGDTMIVTDPDAEDVYVVMDIDQYEMLLDVTGEMEFEEDVSDFEREPEEHPSTKAEDPAPENIWEAMKPANEEGETWDPGQMNEEELADLERQYQVFAQRNVKAALEETQKISENVPEPEKIAEKQAQDDELGEEQFYLEPVE
ncbi:MAG: hypothetical protein AAB431_03160 [Patescibacteria group bacterium]